MRPIVLSLFLLLCLAVPVSAQVGPNPPTVGPNTLQAAVSTNANGSSLNTQIAGFGFQLVTYVLSGTFSATVNFEGTQDQSYWVALSCFPVNGGTMVTTATSTGAWRCNLGGAFIQVRARISGYASGSVTVTATASYTGTVNNILPNRPNPTAIWFCSDFPDGSTAISQIGSTSGTLIIDTSCHVTGNATVPSTLALEFWDPGTLSVNAGMTVTINGPIIAGDIAIFTGPGTVTYGSGSLARFLTLASYWGKTDLGLQAAINAMTAAGGGTVLVSPGTYTKGGGTWATITMKDHVALVGPLGPLGERTGQTGKGAVLNNTDNVDTLTYATTGDASLSTLIQGLSFEGSGTGAHITIPSGSNRLVIRWNSFTAKTNGIKATDSVYDLWIIANTFYNQTGHQLWLTGTLGMGPSIYIRDNYMTQPAANFNQIRYDNSASIGPAIEITGNVIAGPSTTTPLVDLSAGGNVTALRFISNDLEGINGATVSCLAVKGVAVLIEGNQFSTNGSGNGVGIAFVSTVNSVVQGNRFGAFTNAVSLDAASSDNYLGVNSSMTPISNSGTRTSFAQRVSDGSSNLVINSTGGLSIHAGVGLDVNYNAVFTDGITGRGAGSGVDLYAGGSAILRLYNDQGVGYVGSKAFSIGNEPATPLAGSLFLNGVTQSTLGTPTNGTIVYCQDCTIANPCAGGGTGALAKRLNGAWVCN